MKFLIEVEVNDLDDLDESEFWEEFEGELPDSHFTYHRHLDGVQHNVKYTLIKPEDFQLIAQRRR